MEKYKFFNSAPDDPRTYEASDFAEYFGSVLSTGLLHTDHVPGMEVSVAAGTLNTVVSAGKAIMLGRLYENTSNLTLTHSIPEATLNRIDRIVLRLDLRNSARNIHLAVKEGAAGAAPVPPELTRDNFIYELSLAQILVRANTSQLQQADLLDERLYEDLCGIVYSLISIPAEQFQRQWDEFIGGIKDEGFATTGYVNEQVAAAETNAKNASLPRTGGTLTGRLTVEGGLAAGSGYFEVDSYNDTTHGSGKMQSFYNANTKTWDLRARDAANSSANLIVKAGDFEDSTGTKFSDLKQSVVDGKGNIEAAIIDKGGTVSKAGSVATFDELANSMGTLIQLSGSQDFTIPGRHTFIVPKGIRAVKAIVIGGGGGGAGGRTSGSDTNSGGGGGGGGIYIASANVTPGQQINVEVGVGGSYGASTSYGNSYGGAGGSSTFGSITAGGGSGGINDVSNGTASVDGGKGGSGGGLGINGTSGGRGITSSQFWNNYALQGGEGGAALGSYGRGGKGGTSIPTNGSNGTNGRVLVIW